jgi:hypothetical protein
MDLKQIVSFLRRVYTGQAEAEELAGLVTKIETILKTGEEHAKKTTGRL